MGIEVISILVGGGNNYMHLFYDDDAAFCVDASNPRILLKALGINFKKSIYDEKEIFSMGEDRKKRRELVYLFTTHKHLDHSAGIRCISEESPNTKTISGFSGDICKSGDKFRFKDVEIECFHTPCHTVDSFCFYVGEKYLATGDTLLFLGCGKFFGGTPGQMIKNIEEIKKRVNHDAVLLYGHDYSEQNIRFTEEFYHVPEEIKKKKFLKLAEEIKYNPFFNLKKVSIEGSEEEVMGKLRERKNKFSKE
ncbi:HYDROXYACYL GLUTATHION HYDROLASE [Encephalitozoon cuniculi GB-M1]|uniref:Probable hydroxyacylglutathione hydrolase ECU02_0580 n=2 Tax=Encephalitozoon cuniculi TaxID=6035 RepID=GLO2_ENCCU|nr:hydroxyacylglutathione hydrolase [Encephalitozoon cuniculi GB-M1]Q8SSH0.2 RecName: Full=Probable hydroxyacylglutathione hydrolase ECU02_0580; AltName: Full=Glyoxalase II; Short=Glx II [Encephalitozoon cuniculi GB-M1]KMV66578.1 hydroxyacylglutathione hydrolase [Encephalitozoon cuniculi EcunIII-L]UYI28249.1 hydroxyacylglutathione hydrolase [Encephalitozoon cuniculi]CAD25089.2 HYDROXYACYL GLUTATHION HYDROLASE [Encephalitozoon cuniculi GB-M1]